MSGYLGEGERKYLRGEVVKGARVYRQRIKQKLPKTPRAIKQFVNDLLLLHNFARKYKIMRKTNFFKILLRHTLSVIGKNKVMGEGTLFRLLHDILGLRYSCCEMNKP